MRTFLRAAVPVAALVAVVGADASAARLMMAPSPPGARAISADVVIVGKVVGFAKEPVQAASPFRGAKDMVAYQVATVKVETGLVGAEKFKEIKVGTVLPPKIDPNANPKLPRIGGGPRGRFGAELKEGQELILFLVKHPTADFYIIPGVALPIDMKGEQAKKDLEAVKGVAAVLADPAKALKADKPEARAEAATVIVMKYRAYPALGGEVDQAAIPADESKALLKALGEGDWSMTNRRFDAPPSPLQAFQSLGLTPKDGWVEPVIVAAPGAPPVDYGAVQRDAFLKWLDGPGRDYLIKKNAPKLMK
ncbi:hypothetical protein [Gemmata sp.]|uniref:hypothetical protein n=1 Tax=Gemmata sp. TaxID=1914242 RepID=UPI003F71CC2A